MKETVIIGCPTHDNRLDAGSALGLCVQASDKRRIMAVPHQSSLISSNCNGLLCVAMNLRRTDKERDVKWFAMLHSDVCPDPLWVDTLIDLAEEHDADIVSAAVAIKDARGLTSTALSREEDGCIPHTRITMKQLFALPETFTGATAGAEICALPNMRLLVNTGCVVMRLDRAWLDPSKVVFTVMDRIRIGPEGQWCTDVFSEDWYFALMAARNGAKVMCTRKVKTVHVGRAEFPVGDWGQERDEDSMMVKEVVSGTT